MVILPSIQVQFPTKTKNPTSPHFEITTPTMPHSYYICCIRIIHYLWCVFVLPFCMQNSSQKANEEKPKKAREVLSHQQNITSDRLVEIMSMAKVVEKLFEYPCDKAKRK